MSLQKCYKLKKMLQQWPNGTLATSTWLITLGVSSQLCFRYRKSGWIESVSEGVFKKYGEKITWLGVVFALQTQLKISIHPGALTALSLQGFAHYLGPNEGNIRLFASGATNIPKWFKDYAAQNNMSLYRSNVLPEGIGLTEFEEKLFSIQISTPERAILECLHLAPTKLDLVECYRAMEGLVNLRPTLLQSLLEQCSSIKVRRLFLYMAEKANHKWLECLDVSKLHLGIGDRHIVSKGTYIAAHRITVPKELAEL